MRYDVYPFPQTIQEHEHEVGDSVCIRGQLLGKFNNALMWAVINDFGKGPHEVTVVTEQETTIRNESGQEETVPSFWLVPNK